MFLLSDHSLSVFCLLKKKRSSHLLASSIGWVKDKKPPRCWKGVKGDVMRGTRCTAHHWIVILKLVSAEWYVFFLRWERLPGTLTQTSLLRWKQKVQINCYLKRKAACDQLWMLHRYGLRNNTDTASTNAHTFIFYYDLRGIVIKVYNYNLLPNI